jgi:biopolymer transport protein ExbD
MGSMADIAFLLLIFFLVATTMDAEQGIIRKLPPMISSEPKSFHDRDILVVLINRDDKLMVESKETDIRQHRKKLPGNLS